jgi:intracellular sulfur oxidation DsrE/DsrF family protein
LAQSFERYREAANSPIFIHPSDPFAIFHSKNDMKKSLLLVVLLLCTWAANSQVVSSGNHQIIFQLSNGQAATHEKFLRQLNNILEAAPNAQIEVVTHGMGVDLLLKDSNTFQATLEALAKKGVVFVVCENTLKQRNLTKDIFLPLSGFVPSAILELVIKQEQGWIYIKAGD